MCREVGGPVNGIEVINGPIQTKKVIDINRHILTAVRGRSDGISIYYFYNG